MDTISFKRHRFPPEIIRRAVWLYARFTLSYRDVEDLLAERGLDISYESVRRWFLKFGAPIAQNLRHMRPIPNGYWHLDEMVIVIRGQRYWLWRAIDNGGEVLDFLVQSKRNAQSNGLRVGLVEIGDQSPDIEAEPVVERSLNTDRPALCIIGRRLHRRDRRGFSLRIQAAERYASAVLDGAIMGGPGGDQGMEIGIHALMVN